MAGVFYFSDPHFFHKRLAELRGFGEDVELHNEAIIHGYHSLIKKQDDIVYILGDLTIGGTTVEEQALALIKKLPGRKRIIFGNHDSPSSVHRNPHKNFKKYMEVFEWAGMYMRMKIDGQEAEMCHFPLGDEDHKSPPRYMEHRRPDYGQWMIHGHLHCSWRRKGRNLHVGLDAWNLHPVALEQIVDLVRDEREFIDGAGMD